MRTNRRQGYNNPQENHRYGNRENQSTGRWQQSRYPETNQNSYENQDHRYQRFREDERLDRHQGPYNSEYEPDYERGGSQWNSNRNYDDRSRFGNGSRYSDRQSGWSGSDYDNEYGSYGDMRDQRDYDDDYTQRNEYRDRDDERSYDYGRSNYNENYSDRRRSDESSYRGENEDYTTRGGYTTRSGRSGYGGRSNTRNRNW